MIGQLLGRPSPTLRRGQVFLILFFWIWRLYKGDGSYMHTTPTGYHRHRPITSTRVRPAAHLAPTIAVLPKAWWRRVWSFLVARRTGTRWMTNINERLKYFTPYQLILGTMTLVYALRHADDLLGIGPPEPHANMYSRSYYRATYINTALDAGFSTAMSIRPKWVRDISSLLFAGYYLIYSNEADETLRKYRALCSVEMLRTTWEKTFINPYLRFAMKMMLPKMPIVKYVMIPRPAGERQNLPAVKAMFFFDGTEAELAKATELVIDYPGGGFISMGPECHEERLRCWAKRTGKPVVSIDYGKAPEYPYPWAIEEGIDAYVTIHQTFGGCLGIKSGKLRTVLTGDSAGGNICTTITNRILEHGAHVPRPVAIFLSYPALDFNFTSFMSPDNLKVLKTEQSETHIPGLLAGKDHLRHAAPLSVVDDVKPRRGAHRHSKSWVNPFGMSMMTPSADGPSHSRSSSQSRSRATSPHPRRALTTRNSGWFANREGHSSFTKDNEDDSGCESSDSRRDAEKSLRDRVKTPGAHLDDRFKGGILEAAGKELVVDPLRPKRAPLGTRLTMTSRVGYFQDRIITPSMMRAMAILYVGPQQCPDFSTDYYISPILTPSHLLAHFPPVYMICGERDPFVDDTVLFAGKLREAKRARRNTARKAAAASEPDDVPDPILRETDDDWVQMRIIEGWGHGFMQMSALMKEVEPVLIEMADWIDESFERANLVDKDEAAARSDGGAAQDSLPSPLRSRHVKPATHYPKIPDNERLGDADLGGLDFAESGEDEGMISFTPKTKGKKRTPPPSQFISVPRRSSKESLLPRNNSAPKFDDDIISTSTSSESPEVVQTPKTFTFDTPQPRGSGAFALFGRSSNSTPRQPPTAASALYGAGGLPPRRSDSTGSSGSRGSRNSVSLNGGQAALQRAAAAAARAASPALAAAGIVPQKVSNLSGAELMRRRRAEAVLGMEDPEKDEKK